MCVYTVKGNKLNLYLFKDALLITGRLAFLVKLPIPFMS